MSDDFAKLTFKVTILCSMIVITVMPVNHDYLEKGILCEMLLDHLLIYFRKRCVWGIKKCINYH